MGLHRDLELRPPMDPDDPGGRRLDSSPLAAEPATDLAVIAAEIGVGDAVLCAVTGSTR